MANGEKATVLKHNGTMWVNVGNPGFSVGQSRYNKIVIDTNDVPYVGFSDLSFGAKASVMKFDGNNWVFVVDTTISNGTVYDISMNVNNSNEIMIAYMEPAAGGKAVVKKLSGNTWTDVGTYGVSNGQVYYTSLAIDNINHPLVGFADATVNTKSTVLKYDGNNWQAVGNAGFSNGTSHFVKLAVSPNNDYYLAFADDSNSVMKSLSVMRYGYPASIDNILQHTGKLQVYPNPAKDFVMIDLPNPSSIINVKIIDSKGGLVSEIKSIENNKLELNIEELPEGIYFVFVNQKDSTQHVCKFLKISR